MNQKFLNIRLLQAKSLSAHIKFVFTRALYQTQDIARQQAILGEIKMAVTENKA